MSSLKTFKRPLTVSKDSSCCSCWGTVYGIPVGVVPTWWHTRMLECEERGLKLHEAKVRLEEECNAGNGKRTDVL